MNVKERVRALLALPALQVLLVYAAFMLPRREVWGAITRVPPHTFNGSFILFEALHQRHIVLTFAALAALAIACFRWRWSDLELGRPLRWVLGAVVVAQAWLVVGAPYNLVTDHSYGADRTLALVLAALALGRPAFLPLLTAVGLLFAAQEDTPIEGFNWTERRVFLDVQIAFAGFLLVRRLTAAKTHALLFLCLAIVGGAYVWPGVNKLQIGPELTSWLRENDLGNLFMSCWATGFHNGMSEPTAVGVARTLGSLSAILAVATLAIEFSGALLVVHRRLTPLLLLLFVGMHVGIFLSSGILFWKWMVVDTAFAAFFWRHGAEVFAQWPRWLRAAGVVAVALSHWTLEPQTLGWWDTRFSRVYDLEVVVKDGSVKQLSPHDLAPFDLPFIQARIAYAADAPTLTGTFGSASSYATWKRLQAADPKAVQRMQAGRKSGLDETKARRLDRMLQASAATLNKYGGRAPLWWIPSPPAHMHHQPRAQADVGPRWTGQPITAVRIRLREVFYDGQRMVTLTNRIVREIPVDRAKAAKATKAKKDPAFQIEPLRSAAPRSARDRGSDLVFADACTTAPTATIALMNDVTLHQPLQEQAFADGYDSLWGQVKPMLAAADATWVNVEGTLGCCDDADGQTRPDPGRTFDDAVYTSGKKGGLNMHPDLATELKKLGIDVTGTANNHALDRGPRGVVRTLDVLEAAGLPHTGTRRTPKDPWSVVTQVKGLNVAWLACTEWLNNKKPDEQEGVLNCTTQRDEVLSEVRRLANDAAVDAIVFLPSGGIERRVLPDERLRSLATDAAEAGATVVASYHPHHLQTWEKYTTKDQREVPLIWNRGNWITFEDELEQRASTIAYVGLARVPGKKARVVDVAHVPVALQHQGDRRRLVLSDASHEAAAYDLSVSRFGATMLHPPTLPLDVHRRCSTPTPPHVTGAGLSCVHDEECAPTLTCQGFAPGNALCTSACDPDHACDDDARCVLEPSWATEVCLRACVADDECSLGLSCVSRGGAKVCAPLPPK